MRVRGESPRGELNGFLDAGSHIEGELRFEDTFRVDGKVTGQVRSAGALIVGEHGEIEGELEVGSVSVSGTVRGTIRAARRIEISPTGRVWGELVAPVLVIEDGAFFEGRSSMQRADPETPGATVGVPARVAQLPRQLEG